MARDFPFLQPIQPPRPFQVMAHRGEARQAPENTRPALQRCVEDGFEWAEVDVKLTKDGTHILSHDDGLVTADGTRWKVSDHTVGDLQKLDLGSTFAARYRGEPPLTLADALTLARGRINLYLDCKAVDPARLAADILQAGMERQVVVYGKPELLRQVETAAPGRLALMTHWHPGTDPGTFVEEHHLAAVEIDADKLNADLCRTFHELGVRVEAKCLDSWDTGRWWDAVIAAGVDYIQTDLPEEVLARAILARLQPRPVRFSLHRGANRYAPENTLPAFEKGIRLGADLVEFDVRTTKDGRFYLLHDSTLDGKTDGHGPISGMTAADIETLSAGVKFGRRYQDVRLPTLEAFLAAVENRVDLYFDAKAIPPEALSEAVERHRMAERTWVYQSPDYLARLKAINPRIRRMPPLDSAEELASLVAKVQPQAVDANWDNLSPELIRRCHAAGIRVFSDALGSHERVEDYLRAIEWGIDVIQTDHPMRVLRAMELRGAGRGTR